MCGTDWIHTEGKTLHRLSGVSNIKGKRLETCIKKESVERKRACIYWDLLCNIYSILYIKSNIQSTVKFKYFEGHASKLRRVMSL